MPRPDAGPTTAAAEAGAAGTPAEPCGAACPAGGAKWIGEPGNDVSCGWGWTCWGGGGAERPPPPEAADRAARAHAEPPATKKTEVRATSRTRRASIGHLRHWGNRTSPAAGFGEQRGSDSRPS